MITLKKLIVAGVIIFLLPWSDRIAAQTPPDDPPPGVLIDIGGHKLHIKCVGKPGRTPTVVFEAGMGGFSSAWTDVQDILAPRARTCAYDRSGLGWSEQGPRPQTMHQVAFELHALLQAAKEPGPFVLVSHSIGGLMARVYLEMFDSDVAGMVLVDPTPESYEFFRQNEGRWVRIREMATGRTIPEPRLDSDIVDTAGAANNFMYMAEEFQQLYLARKTNPQPLGTRPLIVLAAGQWSVPPGTADDLSDQLRIERDGQKIDLTRLSQNAKFILDPASSHTMQADNPRLVARAVEEVLAAVATGRPLEP